LPCSELSARLHARDARGARSEPPRPAGRRPSLPGNVLLPTARARTWEPGEDYVRSAGGLYVPADVAAENLEAERAAPRRPLAIDLFAGAGGFSLGFHQAGWHVVAASEWDVDAAHTYLVNLGSLDTRIVFCAPDDRERWRRGREKLERYHAKTDTAPLPFGSGWIANQANEPACEILFFGDIRALTGERILSELDRESDEIGCVFGGPPCQGFSRAGKRRRDDERNELVFDFMRVVCEIHPHAFVMENVPGLLDMVTRDGIPVIDALALMAAEGGMGTFEAIRRSLADTAGVGTALRTATAGSSRRQPQPGISGAGHVAVTGEGGDQQLDIFSALGEQPSGRL
jgi:DNA (cytosine-5)-methyltransferase 1